MRLKSMGGPCLSFCLKVTNKQMRWHYANEISIKMETEVRQTRCPRKVPSGGERRAARSDGRDRITLRLPREGESGLRHREPDEHRAPHGLRHGHAHPGRPHPRDRPHNPQKRIAPCSAWVTGRGSGFTRSRQTCGRTSTCRAVHL